MIKKQHILFFIAITLICVSASAQDKLLFLNGKTLDGKILEQTDYEFSFQNSKNKQYSIDKYRVFSFTKNNSETIVYKTDSLVGNLLAVNDMQLYVYGEKEAHASSKSYFVSALGLAIGGATGYLMHKDQSFIYIPTPLIFTALTLPFGTSVKKQKEIKNPEYLKEDEYLRGYDRVARSKRTTNALKSSFAGMGAGFIISLLINK